MFDLLVADILRFSHLLSVAAGFGVAVETEIFMMRRRKSAISPGLQSGIEHRHRVILYALGAMWVTGMALIALRTGFQLSAFTPKLWAKISVVAILTINALFISEVALPILKQHAGKRITALPNSARRALFAVAGISATSWIFAMALGSSALLKVAPAWLFQSLLPVAYIAGILVANLVGQKLYAPAKRPAPARRAVQTQPKPVAQTTEAKTARPKPPRAAVTKPLPAAEPEVATARSARTSSDAKPVATTRVPVANEVAARTDPAVSAPQTPKPRRKIAPKLEPRATDLAIAFPQKLKRKPRLKADPLNAPSQSAARDRLAEVAAELAARG